MTSIPIIILNTNCLLILLLIDFQTWESTECPERTAFGAAQQTDNFELAFTYCSKTNNCYGIYDVNCNKQPPFFLCRSNYLLKKKDADLCTHTKAGKRL